MLIVETPQAPKKWIKTTCPEQDRHLDECHADTDPVVSYARDFYY